MKVDDILRFLSSRASIGDRGTPLPDDADLSPPLIAVIGPTAVGKTDLAIELALKLDAEIVSADSRQIFRELTIGTAKPGTEQLNQVPHHFIDEKTITEPFTAAEFAQAATARIDDIHARDKGVLVVGGSTLYIHALLFGLDDVPPTDPDIRRRLSARLKSNGLESLVEELTEVDPDTAGRIDLQNPRRVLRALEVYHSAGKPLSQFQEPPTTDLRPPTTDLRPPTIDLRPPTTDLFILNRPRDILYDRINSRVDSMIEEGLIGEVRQILAAGHSPSLQALQTIGYRETIRHLDGEIDQDEMVNLIKRNSRRYAKRQLTWFRRYDRARWIDLNASPQ